MQNYLFDKDDLNCPFQRQIQLNKQQIEQLELLRFSHQALMNLLSLAEKFAKYRSNDIKSEFVWQIYYFQKIMLIYIKKFGPYTFPHNFPKERIFNDIYCFIQKIHDKDRYLYYAMIDLFHGKKLKIDFDILFDELDKQPKIKIPINDYNQKCINENECVFLGNKKYNEKYESKNFYKDFK